MWSERRDCGWEGRRDRRQVCNRKRCELRRLLQRPIACCGLHHLHLLLLDTVDQTEALSHGLSVLQGHLLQLLLHR